MDITTIIARFQRVKWYLNDCVCYLLQRWSNYVCSRSLSVPRRQFFKIFLELISFRMHKYWRWPTSTYRDKRIHKFWYELIHASFFFTTHRSSNKREIMVVNLIDNKQSSLQENILIRDLFSSYHIFIRDLLSSYHIKRNIFLELNKIIVDIL